MPDIASLKRRARERARLPFPLLYLCISRVHCIELSTKEEIEEEKRKSKGHWYWQLVFEQGKGIGGRAGGLQFIFFFEETSRKTNRGLGILRKSFVDAFLLLI